MYRIHSKNPNIYCCVQHIFMLRDKLCIYGETDDEMMKTRSYLTVASRPSLKIRTIPVRQDPASSRQTNKLYIYFIHLHIYIYILKKRKEASIPGDAGGHWSLASGPSVASTGRWLVGMPTGGRPFLTRLKLRGDEQGE